MQVAGADGEEDVKEYRCDCKGFWHKHICSHTLQVMAIEEPSKIDLAKVHLI